LSERGLNREYDDGTTGRHARTISNQETIKGIREQLKAIKEAITIIEFNLSQFGT
jgi:hypothetical protein